MQEPAVVQGPGLAKRIMASSRFRQLLRRRWDMQNPLVAVIDDPDPFVPRGAGCGRPASGSSRVSDVRVVCSPSTLPGVRGLSLIRRTACNRPIVVEEIMCSLRSRGRRPARIMSSATTRVVGSPFELARSDRLLDQRINDEPVTEVRIRHLFGDADSGHGAGCRFRCRAFCTGSGSMKKKGRPPGVAQRQRGGTGCFLDSFTPSHHSLVVQAIRGNEVAQPCPQCRYLSIDRWVEALVQHLGETVAVLGKQCIERSWCEGQLHGRASARHPSRLATMTAGDDYPSLSITFYHFWEN